MKPRKLTREDHQLTETASVNLTEQRRIDRYPLRSQTCYVRTERRQGEVPAMHNDITTWRCKTCGVWSFLSNHETFAACAGLEIDEESFGPTQSGVYYILPCVFARPMEMYTAANQVFASILNCHSLPISAGPNKI